MEQGIRGMSLKIENRDGVVCEVEPTPLEEITKEGYYYEKGVDGSDCYTKPDGEEWDYYVKIGNEYYHHFDGHWLYQLFAHVPCSATSIDSGTVIFFDGEYL